MTPSSKSSDSSCRNLLEEALRFQREGQLQKAHALYQQAVEVDPSHADALHLWGLLTEEMGDSSRAIALIQKAIELKPSLAEYHNNCGGVWYRRGNLQEAARCFQAAIKLKPGLAMAHSNMGQVLQELGRYSQAIASYRTAIQIDPDYLNAHYNLGHALQEDGQLRGAMQSFETVLRLRPGFTPALNNLGHIFHNLGRLDEAITTFRSAVSPQPEGCVAHSNMLLALNFHPKVEAKQILAEHLNWSRLHAKNSTKALSHKNDRNPERRLRIGYVSSDYRRHPVAHFMEPILAGHDSSEIETFCYTGRTKEDEMTEHLKKLAHHWRPIGELNDNDAAAQIVRDQIDILVDLSGHTAGNRALLFARKPAPIQVSYLGYPTTTGLSTMDYRLTDHWADPPGKSESNYVEKLFRLPNCAWCYRPIPESPEVSPSPSLATGQITFGSLNFIAKINSEVICLWSRILEKLPNSRLLLLARRPDEVSSRFQSLFKAQGISPDRIQVLGHVPPGKFLAYHHQMDIALDPFPCNGGTTSCDALWMGVPLITLEGSTFVSRAGVTLLQNVGLSELIAKSADEYVEKAVALARDGPRLTDLRSSIRSRMLASPIMATRQFTRDLERAYRLMWKSWCEQNPREILKVEAPSPEASEFSDILLLALDHQQQGRHAEAQAIYTKVLRSKPEHAGALHGMGLLANQLGGHEIGNQLLERAIRAYGPSEHSSKYDALTALGDQLHKLKHFDQALTAYLKLIDWLPKSAPARYRCGVCCQEQMKWAEAEIHYRKAVELQEDFFDAWINLGLALKAQGRFQEAIGCFEKSISLRPQRFEGHHNLACAFKDQGRMADALVGMRKVAELHPVPREAEAHLLLMLATQENVSPEENLKAHKEWAQKYANPLGDNSLPHGNTRDPERRLRIGYVSADLRRHPVSYFIDPILARHDRSKVEVFCYFNHPNGDEITDKLRRLCDHWRDIPTLSDQDAAAMIRRDGIDILVDLSGHTMRNRLLTFARKPAPIQVTYLGYPTTTGLEAMDYRLSDAYADPVGMTESHYVEKVIRLPNCTWCYQPPTESGEVSELPALKNGYLTFGSLNAFSKVGPSVIALWSKVLQATPRSRILILVRGGRDANPHVLEDFARHGISPDRVDLIRRLPTVDYFRLFHQVDLTLDPFPCNGGTTTSDSLWMGVPTITLAGRVFVSRAGVSLLTNLELTRCIAQTPEEYIKIASDFAANIDQLRTLRLELRERMRQSPLMDAPRFLGHLENAYRTMWLEWCK